jgi:CheY-like chemotaxis protein
MKYRAATLLDRTSSGGNGGSTGLATPSLRKDAHMLGHTEKLSRVLLVEDSPFLRYAFGRLLRLQGYDVMEAADGRAALECFEQFQPQLVITDLTMPVMDGVALMEAMRDDPSTAQIPVVAITADSSHSAEHRARAAGAVDVITKPIDLPDLLARLREYAV